MTNPTDKPLESIKRPLLHDEVFDIICGPMEPPDRVVEVDGKFSFFWENGIEVAYKYGMLNETSSFPYHSFLVTHKNFREGRVSYTASIEYPSRAFGNLYRLLIDTEGFQEAINSL